MLLHLVVVLCVLFVAFAERKSELVLLGDDNIAEVVRSPRPSFNLTDIPESLDYRSQGLLTADLNQHIPVYW